MFDVVWLTTLPLEKEPLATDTSLIAIPAHHDIPTAFAHQDQQLSVQTKSSIRLAINKLSSWIIFF